MKDVAGTRRVLAGGMVVRRVLSVMPEVDLWWLRVEDGSSAWLCPEELARMGRLRFAGDRRAFVAKRRLVRGVLSEYAPVRPEEWGFTADAFGKPRAEGAAVEFSLARSGEMAVCAVSRGGRVGVDVEDERLRPGEAMPEWVLAPGELEAVQERSGKARRATFLRYWTLKEALVKGLGCGLSLPVERVAFGLGGEIRVDLPAEWGDGENWGFEQLRIEGRYAVAVAANPHADAGRWTSRITMKP